MEFKNVVIVNCNEDNIPYSKSDEGINIEEERRLFYVGITRAK
ncbi:ATP-dependent helicase, partial [Clostridium botulinum]|nr:ATP-dependent helicase [Clostridium botulinum]